MDLVEIVRSQRAHARPGNRQRRAIRERKLRASGTAASDILAATRAIRALTAPIQEAVAELIFPLIRRFDGSLTDAAPVAIHDDFAADLEAALNRIRSQHLELSNRRAAVVAESLVARANSRNRERFYASIEAFLGINVAALVDEAGLRPILRLKARENVNLITSIAEDYLGQVETLVFEHVITGRDSSKSMIEALRDLGAKSDRRAKFIARDQTAKLTAALNRERNQALGITEYVWRTVRDERVRESHRKRNGKTFRWDDPPKGGPADGGHPGESINCRCTAEPRIVV